MKSIRLLMAGLADTERATLSDALRRLGYDAVFEPAGTVIEAESKLRVILESALDAVILTDRDGRITNGNGTAEEMFRCRAHDLIGRPISSLLSDRHGKEGSEDLLHTLSGQPLPLPGQRAESEGLRSDGSPFPAELRIGEWTSESDAGYCLFVRDMSEKKKREQARGELESQLMRAQKVEAIAALAAGIAHDFNNMLTVILGNADLAMALMEKEHPAADAIEEIHNAAGRAASLTRQLLLFSHKQPMQRKVVDIHEILDDLAKMLQRLMIEGIRVSVDTNKSLWPVLADAALLQQAVVNLVVNARDALPRGGSIAIRAENKTFTERPAGTIGEPRPGRFACISVADTGTGIDPELRAKIFEPFFTTKPPGKGAGIGLSVVARVIRDHEGWIHVRSEPDRETSFDLYLPAHGPDRTTGAAAVTAGGEETTERSGRILLAEDETSVRNFALRALRSQGYEVVQAPTIREALEIFEKDKGCFQLVFSDAVLPDGLGITLAEKVLQHQPPPAVLLTSGYTGKTSQLDPVFARGIPFLPKPYTMAVLLETVKEVMLQGPPPGR
ncbi:MAG: ATP-binding protein [bacterium]